MQLKCKGVELHKASANRTNFGLPKIVTFVPEENIGQGSYGLYIRSSNLKYINVEIVNANLRKICYQDLLAEYPRDIIMEICLLYWLF